MLIAFRHGRFPLNEHSLLTGEAAFQAMETPIPPEADNIMDLLPEGREQAERLRRVLAEIAIYACLRSPTLRTKTTAEIALADQALPGGTQIVSELRERSRGKFSYAPNAWAYRQPDYPSKKSVLDWQPSGIDYNGNPGESIRQVRDNRVPLVLHAAHEAAAEGTVALSTHAEWMVALRAYYLGFDDRRFRQPLIPDPPVQSQALTTAKMIINGQLDMYDCTCASSPASDMPLQHMDVFRTVGTEVGSEFDTGWLAIEEMR
jgi:broad specificity phosphatase PhoE